jgi:hypothetical protein
MEAKAVAQEIMNQLKWNGGSVKMMSWGANRFTCGNNENNTAYLSFFVDGYLHKGKVVIVLEWNDTYTIKLFNTKHVFVNKRENVYCDELTDVVDSMVEYNGNQKEYEEKIRTTKYQF